MPGGKSVPLSPVGGGGKRVCSFKPCGCLVGRVCSFKPCGWCWGECVPFSPVSGGGMYIQNVPGTKRPNGQNVPGT